MLKIRFSKGVKVTLLRAMITLILFSCLNLSLGVQAENIDSKLVTAIEIYGNRSISNITILSKMKTQVGSIYSKNVVNDDLKRLYLLGYFSDIDIKTEDFKDGIKITIRVVERPIIEKIKFSGFRYLRVKEETLREVIKSRPAQYLDYPTLKEDSQTLKGMYVKKGFSETGVDYKVEVNEKTNRADVEFIAGEGRKMKIRKIYIEGNKYLPDKRILKLIKTKKAWL
ncbi:MAG: POTRA domain-containing protein, partial [Candidatus Omnitrophota bacterium]